MRLQRICSSGHLDFMTWSDCGGSLSTTLTQNLEPQWTTWPEHMLKSSPSFDKSVRHAGREACVVSRAFWISDEALPSAARGSAAKASRRTSDSSWFTVEREDERRRTPRENCRITEEAGLCNPTPGCNKVETYELMKEEYLPVHVAHRSFNPFSSFVLWTGFNGSSNIIARGC